MILLLLGCVVTQARGGSSASSDGWREVDCILNTPMEVHAELGPVVVWTGSEGGAWHLQPQDGDDVIVTDDGVMLVYTDDVKCRAWAP